MIGPAVEVVLLSSLIETQLIKATQFMVCA